MPSAADFRMASRQLERSAAWLAGALDPLAGLTGPHVWRGPVADRFDDELQDQRRRLRALADELVMAARMLAVDADQLERPSDQPSGWLVAAGRPA